MNIDINRHLTNSLFMSDSELLEFSKTCPHRYKVYEIPKKNGGTRTIAHPARELKYIQRLIVNILRLHLQIHRSAFAYLPKKNIKQNAELHANSNYLLKMDFKDFFPSITPQLFFQECLKNHINLSKEDTFLVTNFLFWKRKRTQKLVLSIGAPSSPLISNFIMYSFDSLITAYCDENQITYSRYADDLTFSAKNYGILNNLPKLINKNLKSLYTGAIKINSEKTIFVSKAHSRKVTGLTLTNDQKVSIGRTRKRQISAMVHQCLLNGFKESKDLEKLKGLINFAIYIDPYYLNFLNRKYGEENIKKLYKTKN